MSYYNNENYHGGMPVPSGMTVAAAAGAVLLAVPVMKGLGKLLELILRPIGWTLLTLLRGFQRGCTAVWLAWDANADMPRYRAAVLAAAATALAAAAGSLVATLSGIAVWAAVPAGLAAAGLCLVVATLPRGWRRTVVWHRPGDRDWLAIAYSLDSRFINIPAAPGDDRAAARAVSRPG